MRFRLNVFSRADPIKAFYQNFSMTENANCDIGTLSSIDFRNVLITGTSKYGPGIQKSFLSCGDVKKLILTSKLVSVFDICLIPAASDVGTGGASASPSKFFRQIWENLGQFGQN